MFDNRLKCDKEVGIDAFCNSTLCVAMYLFPFIKIFWMAVLVVAFVVRPFARSLFCEIPAQ